MRAYLPFLPSLITLFLSLFFLRIETAHGLLLGSNFNAKNTIFSRPSSSDLVIPISPTPSSSWLTERIAIGRTPTVENVHSLMEKGVNVFVCLQAEFSFEAFVQEEYPSSFIRGLIHSPEDETVVQLDEAVSLRRVKSKEDVEFIHIPIKDYSTISRVALTNLVKELKRLIESRDNSILYIHCKGGHGRTGQREIQNFIMINTYLKNWHFTYPFSSSFSSFSCS